MKKIRLADIAREAQVGTATVERVLNARGNVSPTAIDKVIQAARRLGYRNPLPERYRGVLRVEVIMVRRETPFFYRLASAFLTFLPKDLIRGLRSSFFTAVQPLIYPRRARRNACGRIISG